MAPVCRDWDLVKIYEVSKLAQKMKYEPGQNVYSIGGSVSFVFFVLSGQVDL